MSSHSSKYKEVARERGRGDDSLHYSAFARCKSARKDGRTPFRVSVGSRVTEAAARFNESLYLLCYSYPPRATTLTWDRFHELL